MGVFERLAVLFTSVLLATQVQVSEGSWISDSICHISGWFCGEEPKGKLILKVSDIGSDWAYLSWDEFIGDVKCDDDRPFFPISNSTLHCNYSIDDDEFNKEYFSDVTSADILHLSTNVTYSCWVEAWSEASPSCRQHSPQILFIPGDGNVTGVSENHVTIARFTDELETGTTLNCTVEYDGIQTDTVWTIDNYKGKLVEHKDIRGFKVHGKEHEMSNDLCENLVDISEEAVKDINGTTVHCGSHTNRYQAKFEFHICELPPKLVEDVITVWEGTTDCVINVTRSNLKANKTKWSKDRKVISKDGFEMIIFDRIEKEDAGTYLDEFSLTCTQGINSRQFEFSFTIIVLHGPTMAEGQKRYSVYVGKSVTLICGTGLTGNPEPVVTWTHPQAERIQDGGVSRYVITERPHVTLTIKSVTENDEGIWKCIVEVKGKDLSVAYPDPNTSRRTRYVEIEVIVIVPPSEPLDVSVVGVNHTNLLITWNHPMETGSPALSGYKLCFNGTCDMDVDGQSFELSVPHHNQNECYKVTVYAVSESDGVPVEGPHSEHVWIVTDHPRNLTVADIGYDWVYLTWSSFTLTCGLRQWEYNITCSNESNSFSVTTPRTVHNITNLSNATYDCTVVAFQTRSAKTLSLLCPPVSFAPGSESVIGVPNNHVIIARFTDELTSTYLKCTVQKGDIQADTVWNVTGYPNVSKFHIFSDGRQAPSTIESIYGNIMRISSETTSELDGVIVYCGSHLFPRQAKFEFHVKNLPRLNYDAGVVLWRGTENCTIDNIVSNFVQAYRLSVIWKKDGERLREGITNNGFQTIKFDKVNRKDEGLYEVTFEAISHVTSPSRIFKLMIDIEVNYGPEMTKGPGKYSVLEGDSIKLLCGKDLDSNPEATVIWVSPWGEVINRSNEQYVVSNSPNVTLWIKNVTKSDHNGLWKCTVKVEGSDTTDYCRDPDKSKRTLNTDIQLVVVVTPSEPHKVRMIEDNTSTIHVSWSEPLYHGSPYLDRYELCLNRTRPCQAATNSTTNHSIMVSLEQGQIYMVTVYAISESGNVSAPSNSSEAVCFATDAPHSLEFVLSGSDWIFFTWEEPSIVCEQSAYNVACNGRPDINTTKAYCNVTNLFPSTKYNCTVVAVCETGICSPRSNKVPFSTSAVDVKKSEGSYIWVLLTLVLGAISVTFAYMYITYMHNLGPPGKPKASKVFYGGVELTWAPPTNASKVTSYAVFFRSDKDPPGQWILHGQYTNRITIKVEGLSINRTYTFKVHARHNDNMGPESEISDPTYIYE